MFFFFSKKKLTDQEQLFHQFQVILVQGAKSDENMSLYKFYEFSAIFIFEWTDILRKTNNMHLTQRSVYSHMRTCSLEKHVVGQKFISKRLN